jgi:hypothetical protein
MTIASIREYRRVPAKRGMRIFYRHAGRYGAIIGSRGGDLRIRLDGDKHPGNYHPTWELDYLDNE